MLDLPGDLARGGPNSGPALPDGVELPQLGRKVIRQVWHKVSCSSAVRECRVLPEVFQDADHVGLSASIEAAHPCGILLAFAQRGDVRRQDAVEALLVLAGTHEARELV